MKNRVLVLGGTVFLSECIVKHLCKKGYCVDILTRGMNDVNNKDIYDHIICNRNNFVEIKEKLIDKSYDYILDISARTEKDVKYVIESVKLTELRKYILCSTASIFETRNNGVIDSQSICNPVNEYTRGKYEAEQYVIKSAIPYVIVRPTYIIGKNNNLDRESKLIKAILNETPIFIKDVKKKFNPIYVEDLARIFLLLMETEIKDESIMVGGKDIVNYLQFIEICEKNCNKKAIIVNERIDNCLMMPFLNMNVIVKNSSCISDDMLTDLEDVVEKIACI